jgi:hypothetical protein
MNMRFLGLFAFLALAPMPSPAKAAPPPKPLWYTNYGQAIEIARRTGKPLFIVFR